MSNKKKDESPVSITTAEEGPGNTYITIQDRHGNQFGFRAREVRGWHHQAASSALDFKDFVISTDRGNIVLQETKDRKTSERFLKMFALCVPLVTVDLK